ncbi:MAG: hypothetical protein U9N56_02740, partial [Actinomycetota bacterium]|nr:hypothetical protein [Actinomycetota bacterium]
VKDGGGDIFLLGLAVLHAEEFGLPVGVAGWSFGAITSLRWLAATDFKMPYVGIAPGADLLPDVLPDGPKRIILGNRDQVIDGAAVQAYADKQGIDLVVTPGDHFFHGRGEQVGDLVGQALEV